MSGSDRDPLGMPKQPRPWHELDPEDALDPWAEFADSEPPTIPVTLGPASRSGSAAPNPFPVMPPGLDPQASLAEQLSWELPKPPK